MQIFLALILFLAACSVNTNPSPDAGTCEQWPDVPAAACACVYQFDVHDCTWSCSTWGFDGGVK